MPKECLCRPNGLIDNKCVHFGGAYGNPVPDPNCNCYACDEARGLPPVRHVTPEEWKKRLEKKG